VSCVKLCSTINLFALKPLLYEKPDELELKVKAADSVNSVQKSHLITSKNTQSHPHPFLEHKQGLGLKEKLPLKTNFSI
jgi:hypothetical protein